MSKFVEILAMILGGLSLFAVSFVGFTALSGKPLSAVPGVGSMLAQPMTGTEASLDEAEARPVARPRRDERQVVEAGIGVMGAWSLPSPYTQVELKALTDELKAKLIQVEQREAALAEREREAQEKLRTVGERFEVLEGMRRSLEAFEQELELREQEVLATERSMTAQERQMWSDKAAVIGTMEPANAAARLTDYSPEEAAKILRAMDPEQAAKILNSIQDGRWREFVDAYTREGTATERP